MKKILVLIGVYAFSILNAYTQETLQTVTDRGNSTSNRITINPIYQFGSRITAYSGGSGYFDIYNNSNSSISLALKRSDGASVLEVDGHSMDTYFGGNVGIGTTYPNGRLDVNGAILLPGSGMNTLSRPLLESSRITGEISGYSATGLGADDGFLRLSAGGGTNSFTKSFIDLSGFSVVPDMIYNITLGTAGTERMRITGSGNVGIGTTTPKEKLSVNGKIRAHEIKVETANWPDYVFAKDYQLPTLQETETHIKEKGHLSGIPSAAEVKANGIDLGEMNAKLRQKIEELTLHLIEKDKEIKRLDNLNNRIAELESKIGKLINKL